MKSAFADLPAQEYPLLIEFLRGEQVVHRIEVPGPGAVSIPKLGAGLGVRLTTATGCQSLTPPGTANCIVCNPALAQPNELCEGCKRILDCQICGLPMLADECCPR